MMPVFQNKTVFSNHTTERNDNGNKKCHAK